MITCTFIGSKQYDFNLYDKIQEAVENLISKDNEIEFLFYRKTLKFYQFCFLAVLKSKYQFPNKKITLTLITDDIEEEKLLEINSLGLPTWAFDKFTPILLSKKSQDWPICLWNRIERKMVQKSNFVIAYCYPQLHDVEYSLYKYALNQKQVIVSNLIEKKTTNFISESIKTLPYNDRNILEQIDAGCTYAALARGSNVSISAIKQIDSHGRQRLRNRIKRQFQQDKKEHSEMSLKVCSIISINKYSYDTYEINRKFNATINYLTEIADVSTFMINKGDCLAMKTLFSNKANLELCIVTHLREDADIDWNAIQKQYIPPFTKVINIDSNLKPMWARYLFSIKTMIAQSDYVICNLNGSSAMNDRIRRHIKKQKGVTVIDISQSPYISNQHLLI